MKNFRCACGNKLYFENTRCMKCKRTLGYVPEVASLCALEPVAPASPVSGKAQGGSALPAGAIDRERWRALPPGPDGQHYRRCANYRDQGVCNWMVPVQDTSPFCLSCRLNKVIPNLNAPRNRVLWKRIEAAKRRLLYTLYQLGLPVIGRDGDPQHGLAFAFLADGDDSAETDEFSDAANEEGRVLTGHRGGLITINVAEADPSAREKMRESMNELYRTLLGHFRHESGHFYWTYLVQGQPAEEAFRALFGDERSDYKAALETYYSKGPPADWQGNYISAYASSHPWEDWAETWAHYLHLVDTLETAHDNGFAMEGRVLSDPLQWRRSDAAWFAETRFNTQLIDWTSLSLAMNDLNRSMGLPDAYPFSVIGKTVDKLRFVYNLIREASERD